MEPREKILKAAIEVMKEQGDITVRAVTEKAGVNVAAINYHFGNKENLLKEIESYFAEQLLDLERKINISNVEPIEGIKIWACSLMEYMIENPTIIPLIVSIVNSDKSYNPKIVKDVYMNNDMIQEIINLISKATSIKDEKIIGFKYIQISSGIVGPILNEILFSQYGKNKASLLVNEEDRKEYVSTLVESILNS